MEGAPGVAPDGSEVPATASATTVATTEAPSGAAAITTPTNPIATTPTPLDASKGGAEEPTWERDGLPMLTRGAYTAGGIVEAVLARWRNREPSVLVVNGAYGDGKSYYLEYLQQRYFPAEGAEVICLRYIGTDTFSSDPLHGARHLLRGLVLKLYALVSPQLAQQADLTVPFKPLAEREFNEHLKRYFSVSLSVLRIGRERMKTALHNLHQALGVSEKQIHYFNDLLDVDFPGPRGSAKPSMQRMVQGLSVILEAVLLKHPSLELAILIDNIQYLDYCSWECLQNLIQMCPCIFVCATSCLQEEYPRTQSLISYAELCGKPYAHVHLLPPLAPAEIKALLSIKLRKYKRYGMTEERGMQASLKVHAICKGNFLHTTLVLDKVTTLMGKHKDAPTILLKLEDARDFQLALLVQRILENYNDKVANVITLLSVYGDYHYSKTISAIQETSGGLDDYIKEHEDFGKYEPYLNEPFFVDMPANEKLPGRVFLFKNLAVRRILATLVPERYAQLLYRKAFAFFRLWHQFNETFDVDIESPAFPLMLRYMGKLKNLDPELQVARWEQAFFYFYGRQAYPDALFYNEQLLGLVTKKPRLANLLVRREAWLEAAVDVQTKLRIGNFVQRRELCIAQLAKLGVPHNRYPGVGWYLNLFRHWWIAFGILHNASFRPVTKLASVTKLLKRHAIKSELSVFLSYTDAHMGHNLSLLHLLRIGHDLREVDQRLKIKALFQLAANMCVRHHAWSRVDRIYRMAAKMEAAMPRSRGGEKLDDYYLTYASSCLDLGLYEQCLKCLANLDQKPEEGAERSELWYLKSFYTLNIGYFSTGEVAKRVAFAERNLAVTLPSYPISWGICTSMSAMAVGMALQGNLIKARALASASWDKFLVMMDLDNTAVNMIHPTLFLCDYMGVRICESILTIDCPANWERMVEVNERLALEWEATKSYYYHRYALVLSTLQLYTLLYFSARYHELRHAAPVLPKLVKPIDRLLGAFQRLSQGRPTGHPLRRVTDLSIRATAMLFHGNLAGARACFVEALSVKEAKLFPVVHHVLTIRIYLLQLALPEGGSDTFPPLPSSNKGTGAVHDGGDGASENPMTRVKRGLKALQLEVELALITAGERFAYASGITAKGT